MKPGKKLLFFDIDGTLDMPGDPPSQAVVAALKKARSRGHLLFLSTGRTEIGVPTEIAAIGFDGFICSAGGRTVVQGKVLSVHTMEPERASAIMAEKHATKIFFAIFVLPFPFL